jgi:hypothetical protein
VPTFTLNRHLTPSGTNTDTYLPASGNPPISTKDARQVILAVKRFGDVGICTLDTFVEWLFEPDNTWLGLADYAGTAVQMAQMADGVVDATPRLLILESAYIPPGTPTGGFVTTGTTKVGLIWIPEKIRVRFRHGGTTVQNDLAAQLTINYK